MRQIFNEPPWILPKEPKEIRDIYFKHGRLCRIKTNSILKCGGEERKLFYLKSGMCMYIANFNLDKPRVIGVLIKDRAMGDISCITKERVNVTTYAKKGSVILTLPANVLTEYIQNDIVISNLMLQTFIKKHQCTLEGVFAGYSLCPEERLKSFFRSLAKSFEINTPKWISIPIKISNEELGMIINATRVTVSRIKSSWIKKGFAMRAGNNCLLKRSFLETTYDWI